MKLLIEEYEYNVTGELKTLLSGLYDSIELNEPTISLHYVGYYFNKNINDCIFILPKVIIDKDNKVFGEFAPEELINFETSQKCKENHRRFLQDFLVWIYRAISVFEKENKDSKIIFKKEHKEIRHGRLAYCHTLFDVILALLDFNRTHRDFITFILKNQHRGFSKINWTRTLAHSPAIIQRGEVVYLKPVNKKRQVNFDEELFVIYFSILHYVHEMYGFQISVLPGFELITGAKFERYLNGYGKKRLAEIKYKYFSDVALRLWELCATFFDLARKLRSSIASEYLLAKNFNIVFEAMIDELIGEKNIPDELKNQADGKRVDHLYRDQGLIENTSRETYYIGDSKYYKIGNELGKESVYKQYTYARNVIQYNLDLFLDETKSEEQKKERVKKLRDEVTEGYGIIPNFFISADIKSLSYEERLTEVENGNRMSRQFENRLFDRDTLLLSHFNVNFLHILSLYARDNAVQKASWREKVRCKFRKYIRELLQKRFGFYAMMPYDEMSDDEANRFLRENFKLTLGKVYAPYAMIDGKSVYSLALENPESIEDEVRRGKVRNENNNVKGLLGQMFYVVECPLGTSAEEVLRTHKKSQPMPGAKRANIDDSVIVANGYKTGYIDAVKKSGVCAWDVGACRDAYLVEMIIFPHTNHADIFKVDYDKGGVLGPMAVEDVKSRYPAFAKIEFTFDHCYVWSIKQNPQDK